MTFRIYLGSGVAAGQVILLGIASETDAALALSIAKTVQLGLVTEADSGLALTTAKAVLLGIASETDAALALSVAQVVLLGIAQEVDQALGLTVQLPLPAVAAGFGGMSTLRAALETRRSRRGIRRGGGWTPSLERIRELEELMENELELEELVEELVVL